MSWTEKITVKNSQVMAYFNKKAVLLHRTQRKAKAI